MSKTNASNSEREPKSAKSSNNKKRPGEGLSRVSLVVSIISLILILLLLPRVFSTASTDGIIEPTSEPVVCEPGLSAYEVWLSVGNEGTVEDFLDSIVGEKGADGYVGSDGFSGTDGASAYQLWLDAGNLGTPQTFLESLVGASGSAGTDGTDGADGTDGTDGADGAPGIDGADGIGAYQLWLLQGNSGTESDFLEFLIGPTGDTGAAGSAGQSTYELWLEQDGNEGKTEAEFLISLVGAQGPAGADGVCTVGDTGPAGPPGAVSGFGYSGSWHDLSDQVFGTSGAKAIQFGETDYEDGISMVDGSKITFATAGTYDIQFSAQLSFRGGGKDQVVNIWLAKNGESVSNSNTRVIIPGSNEGYTVASWNFFTTVEANDYVELIWNASNSGVQILHEQDSGESGLYQPGIPSIILTVNQVSGPTPQ
jgi:hypothetical protein